MNNNTFIEFDKFGSRGKNANPNSVEYWNLIVAKICYSVENAGYIIEEKFENYSETSNLIKLIRLYLNLLTMKQ